MKFATHQFDYFIWFLCLFGEAYLVWLISQRQTFRSNPIFSTYIVTRFVRSGALLYLALADNYTSYFWAYWWTLLFLAVFGFFVIWELFKLDVTRFCQTAIIALAVTLCISAFSPSASKFPLMVAVHSLERWLWVSGCLIFIAALYDAKPSSRVSAGIGMGMAMYYGFNLLNSSLSGFLGVESNKLLSKLPNLIYPAALVIWHITIGNSFQLSAKPTLHLAVDLKDDTGLLWGEEKAKVNIWQV